MKKISLLFLLMLVGSSSLMHAQSRSEAKPEHKIIFQLTTGDTTAHKQLMKQFGNILSVSPTTKIEVVCHGAGLEMLVIGKTIVEDKIKLFSEKA
jgi:intracellular sulfur oxidation DsrE/DsrF family protein